MVSSLILPNQKYWSGMVHRRDRDLLEEVTPQIQWLLDHTVYRGRHLPFFLLDETLQYYLEKIRKGKAR